jgi:hypothetical protein
MSTMIYISILSALLAFAMADTVEVQPNQRATRRVSSSTVCFDVTAEMQSVSVFVLSQDSFDVWQANGFVGSFSSFQTLTCTNVFSCKREGNTGEPTVIVVVNSGTVAAAVTIDVGGCSSRPAPPSSSASHLVVVSMSTFFLIAGSLI